MRIGLLVGTTLHPLAGTAGVDERVHSSAGNFNMDPEAQQQVANYVRGEHAEPIDRGNLLEIVTFSTSRLFATAAEAQLYVLDYDRTMPRSGTLQIDSIAPNGVVTRRHLLQAVVSPPRRRAVGCTVLLDYQVRGSEVVAAGTRATGTITFTGSPTSGTVTIGGSIYYLSVDTAPYSPTDVFDPFPVNNATTFAAALAARINAWLYGGSDPNVTATSSAGVVTLTAKIPGAAGNSITLSDTAANVAVSGATLTGGAD